MTKTYRLHVGGSITPRGVLSKTLKKQVGGSITPTGLLTVEHARVFREKNKLLIIATGLLAVGGAATSLIPGPAGMIVGLALDAAGFVIGARAIVKVIDRRTVSA